MKPTRLLFVVVLCALALAIPGIVSQARQPKTAEDLMRKKLAHAQKVLEGIAVNDFTKISKNAEQLMAISKAVEWTVIKSPAYEIHSNDFRRAAEALIQRSQQKNLDGAVLAYLDLTMSCVRCHKYVRDTRFTRLDPAFDAVPALLVYTE
jgi:hypothetical protein